MRFWCQKCGDPFEVKQINALYLSGLKYCDKCKKAKHRGNSHLKTQYQTPNIISDCERINRKCPDCGNWFIVPMQLCDLKPKLRSKCEQKKKRMVNE